MSTVDQRGNDKPQNPALGSKDKEALTAFGKESIQETTPKYFESHSITDDLKYVAERYRRLGRGRSESNVRFEMDPEGGQIVVVISDEISGDVQFKMTPEEVAAILKNFESTSDNESTLTSFFIDFEN